VWFIWRRSVVVEGTNANRAEAETKQTKIGNDMKTKLMLKAVAAAAMLGGATVGLMAQDQNTTPACPFGYPPGTGQTLTPEQRADHIAVLQAKVQELRAKREAGTLTQEEQTWLDQVEQRGGYFRTGIPRGGRGERASRQGLREGAEPLDEQVAGRGFGRGPRDGAALGGRRGFGVGPRDGAALGGGRGFGHGLRDGARIAGGQDLRRGPRDGTGPRAVEGTCPLPKAAREKSQE
jgi:hypothetical protein